MSGRAAAARALSRAPALAALALLAGCSATPTAAPSGTTSAVPAPTSDPSASRTADCVESVIYWVQRARERGPDHGFDYQEMGLGNDSFEAFREVEKATRGLPTLGADDLAVRAGEACDRHRPTSAPGNGWR